MNTSPFTRIAIITGFVLAAQLVPGTAGATTICDEARCVRDVTQPAATFATGPYAEPLSALGGRTLAEYLADHQARVLRPIGV